MTTSRFLFLVCALAAGLAESARGQRSNWRAYRLGDGLPESACAAVTVGTQGKILAKHLTVPFLSELDGYSVSNFPAPEMRSGRVYESPGGQLWTLVPEGLEEFKDGAWMLHPLPEIAAARRNGRAPSVRMVPLCPVRQGLVMVLLPDRLVEFNSESAERHSIETLLAATQTKLEEFSGMALARDGGLWIAGERGLTKAAGPVRILNRDSDWREYIVPAKLSVHHFQEPHEDDQGGVTMVADCSTNQQQMVVLFEGGHWTAHPAGNQKIRQAWRGPENQLWALTRDLLLELDPITQELAVNEEVSARQYFDVGVESGGSFWLATSEGLFRYAPPIWRGPALVQRINSLIHGLAADAEGRLWFASGSGLHLLEKDRHEEFPFPRGITESLRSDSALFPLKNGKLVIAAGDDLFEFQPDSSTFSALPRSERSGRLKILALLKDGKLCAQRSDLDAQDQELHLEVYDGVRFAPFTGAAPESSIGSNLSALLATQNGDLWLSGNQGVAWYHEAKWKTFISSDKSTPDSAIGFVDLPDGKIWCGTQDKIWEFDGRSWTAVRSGFDRISALLRTRDGSTWVASNAGLHRFFQEAWVENGSEDGLASASVRALCEDAGGHLWAGTTHGISRYYSEADPDPPKTFILPMPEREKNVPDGGSITIAFDGQDKWKHTARLRLLYSCRLDQREWSPFQEGNNISYTDLTAGKHYFQVRAMDRNCNVDPKPAGLEFVVVLPWYKESRPVAIAFAGLAAAIFFAGLAFNRHRQLRQSYAEVEKKVTERTRELEKANRELLHSQKMNALGALAAGIAHDFNNILSIIKGSAQIIEDNLNNPPKVQTRVDRIKTVVEQGAGIVKAMLGFSRESDPEAGPCDLNSAVDDTIKLLGDRFLREVEVTFEPAPSLPVVACSKDLVQQILLNFIFNAAESMAQRKQVIVQTRRLEKVPEGLALIPAPAAAFLAISVKDFGCGIPPENMARIFEPFFTTKALSARRGTGLGLSMVYELAKKMAAGLAVESVVDQGSTFMLILPVQNLRASLPPAKTGSPPSYQTA